MKLLKRYSSRALPTLGACLVATAALAQPADLVVTNARIATLDTASSTAPAMAVRDGRICRFKAEDTDVLVHPGPRMGEAARIMAQCLLREAK